MQLTHNQQLIQEALVGRIQRRSKEIQENVPDQQPNLLAMLTAVCARLSSTSNEDSAEAMKLAVEACSFVLAKEVALASLAEDTQKLREELSNVKAELEKLSEPATVNAEGKK